MKKADLGGKAGLLIKRGGWEGAERMTNNLLLPKFNVIVLLYSLFQLFQIQQRPYLQSSR